MEAIKQFLDENDDFIIDKSRERLLFSMHPNGYLERVRQNHE
jgi:cephalosporin hydroxylase|tara:strand:+ start:499 stop:624 length:126 start_codon:yes stop_codon:yes gene_type:complete